MIDIETLSISKHYTDESIAGGGAIKGKNCKIQSITDITGGHRVTFLWSLDNDTEQTSTMDVMDGEDGKGIASVTINAEEHLIITYTDGTTTDAGEIDVQSAVDSVNGQTGDVVLTASDVGALPDDTTLADLSGDSTHRTVTDAEKTAWDAKSDFSGSYNDLTDKPTIPDEISDLDDTAISSPTNGQVMTYDSTAGKWKNADNNPTITVDSALSTTSENPVQNKVLTTEINKKAEYEEISWEDYQALSYAEKHNGKQYFVTGAPGSAVSASGVSYDNTTSGMTADNVQDALDELAAGGGQITVDSAMSTTSTNPLQNKVITLEIQDMQASMLNDELKLSAVELAVSQLQTSVLNNELRLSAAELAVSQLQTTVATDGLKLSALELTVSQLQTSMLNMDGAVDDIEDEIADVVNVYGSKNLMETTASSHTQNGITETVNADGSFTLNGTATKNTYFYWIGPTQFPTENIQYTYSIETSAVWGIGQAIAGIDKRSETAYIDRYKSIFADGTTHIEGTFTGESGYYAWAWIFIPNGTQLTNVIVKGMIRLASIKDDTFVPYAKTNGELTIDKAEQAEVDDIVNVLGAKNLLQYPYYSTTITISGVTITDNGDGTLTLDGTATDRISYNITATASYNLLEIGKKYLIGFKTSDDTIDSNSWALRIYCKKDSTTVLSTTDSRGSDVAFTVPEETVGANVQFIIVSGTVLNNVVIKPMIRLASVKDDTYVPYVPTNKELMSCKLNGMVGAKNLLPYPYKHTTKSENGVTFTDNGDGTITVNTPTFASAETTFYLSQSIQSILDTGMYILSGCPSGGDRTSGYFMEFAELATSSSNWKMFGTDTGEGAIAHIDSTRYVIHAYIRIRSGATVSNLTFKPMLRLASDTDNTYQPYAMTNKELTDIIPSDASASNKLVTRAQSGAILPLVNLGTEYTAELKADISSGKFEKAVVGGYLTINGHVYYLAHPDYWLHTGDTECTTHHMLVIPAEGIGTGKMNNSNITTGAYAGSDMKTGNNSNTALATAAAQIKADFGAANILTHRELFTKTVTNGKASDWGWYDSDIDLMNEVMVYGCNVWASAQGYETGIDKCQIKLFQERPDLITTRANWWLRSVVSATLFAYVNSSGHAYNGNASYALGVRPVFAIIGD